MFLLTIHTRILIGIIFGKNLCTLKVIMYIDHISSMHPSFCVTLHAACDIIHHLSQAYSGFNIQSLTTLNTENQTADIAHNTKL